MVGVEVVGLLFDLGVVCDMIILFLFMVVIVVVVMEEFGLYLIVGIIVIDIFIFELDIIKGLVMMVVVNDYIFLDGFVSGGLIGVCSGIMMMVVGGDFDVFVKVCFLFEKMIGKLVYIGLFGVGYIVKIVNNFLCVVNFVLMSEMV